MIEKYAEKAKNGQIQLEFAESGSITIIERKFDENTGVPLMKPTQETNSKHLEDLIAEAKKQMLPFQNRLNDLEALSKDVAAKEAEREKLITKKEKVK